MSLKNFKSELPVLLEQLQQIELKHIEILKLKQRELETVEQEQKKRLKRREAEEAPQAAAMPEIARAAYEGFGKAETAIKKSSDELKVFEDMLRRIEKRSDHLVGRLLYAFEVSALGQKNFARAMEEAVQRAISVLASEALVRAAMETAAGFAAMAHPFLRAYAPLHFKAAAIYAGVGAGAGIGLAAMGGSGQETAASYGHYAQPEPPRERESHAPAQQVIINVSGAASDRDIAEAVYEGLKKAKKYGY